MLLHLLEGSKYVISIITIFTLLQLTCIVCLHVGHSIHGPLSPINSSYRGGCIWIVATTEYYTKWAEIVAFETIQWGCRGEFHSTQRHFLFWHS